MVSIKPDFDAQSRNGQRCSISGLPRVSGERTNKLPNAFNERNPYVITLDQIDFEGDFDVLPDAIREVAKEHCGMVDGELHEATVGALEYVQGLLDQANAEIERLNSLVGGLVSQFQPNFPAVPETVPVPAPEPAVSTGRTVRKAKANAA